MLNAPGRLIAFAAKHLASSLSKGGTLHPLFHQPVLKMAQRMGINLADEKKAIEATVHYLLCFTTIGAASVGLVYEHKYSLDREKQYRLEIEQIVQNRVQRILQRLEKIEQKMHKYQEIDQIRRGFPTTNHVTDAMRADMELWSRQSTMKN